MLLLWFPRYFDWSPFLWKTAEVVKESGVTMQHCIGTLKLIVNFTDWTKTNMGMSVNFCDSFCTASQQFGGRLPHLKRLSYQGANVARTTLLPPLLSLVYYNFYRLLRELKKVSWFYDVVYLTALMLILVWRILASPACQYVESPTDDTHHFL